VTEHRTWLTGIIEAARPMLIEDRDTTLVLWPTGATPFAHGRYKLALSAPGQMPSAKLRPYFAAVARMTGNAFNGYVVVRYGNKIIVYSGADTILTRSVAATGGVAARLDDRAARAVIERTAGTMPRSRPPRVVCPHCERTRSVRADGNVRAHTNPVTGKQCYGTGRSAEYMELAP
jgi:hypothetical protein